MKSKFSLAALFISSIILNLLLHSCRRSEINATNDGEMVEKFFKTPENLSSSVRKIAEDIKNQNDRNNFLPEFIRKNGLPVWDKVLSNISIWEDQPITSNTRSFTSDSTLFFIPLQSSDSRINSYISVLETDGVLKYKLFQKNVSAFQSDNTDSLQLERKVVPAMKLFALFEKRINNQAETSFPSTKISKIKDVSLNFNSMQPNNTSGRSSDWIWIDITVCGYTWVANGYNYGVEPGGATNSGGYVYNCNTTSYYVWAQNEIFYGDDGGGGSGDNNWWTGGGGGGTQPVENQGIIDSLQGYPCAQAILAQMPNLNAQVNSMLQTFLNVNDPVNIKFKPNPALSSTLTDGRTFDHRFENGVLTSTIEINPWMLEHSTKEYILLVFMHESLHAYMDYQWRLLQTHQIDTATFQSRFPIFWDYRRSLGSNGIEISQHLQMAETYISFLTNMLLSFNPTLMYTTAKSLAWNGLRETTLWSNNLTDTNHVLQTIIIARDTTSQLYPLLNLRACD